MSTLKNKFGFGATPTRTVAGTKFVVPDYPNISDDDYRAAFAEAMAEQLAGIAAIVADPEPPSVKLLADIEATGLYLTRVGEAFFTLKSADTNAARDAIDEDISPALAKHTDAIALNRGLYDKLVELQNRAAAGEVTLDEQDAWLLSEQIRHHRRAGIDLAPAEQERLRAINEELATMGAKFSTIIVKGRGAACIRIDDVAELDGLSDEQLAACKLAAETRGWPGWALELVNTTQQPLLASLNNRATREKLFKASVGRSVTGDTDVRPLMLQTVALRSEKAKLLGFPTYAEYVADDGCAKTTATFMPLLRRVATAAVANAKKEAVALQAELETYEPGATLEAWDWQWLAEKQRAKMLNLDNATLSAYFPFEQVLEQGVFAAANALYGITFERIDVPGYTADCRAYLVRDFDGSDLALALFDPYARASKEGGAWMTGIVDQSTLFDTLTVVTNNCNQPKPAPGRPSLMTWREVETLFHEFGHDLHGILTHVKYPSTAGTATPTDFVEYPSQVNEIWGWLPELIEKYARHFETGEALPQHYIDALSASRHFGEGYASAEIYQATYLDQMWHQLPRELLPETPDDIEDWERKVLEDAGLYFPLVPPRYKSTYFSHIWGVGYAANYYAYMWSEVMDADTANWFMENGGLRRELGQRFRDCILSHGGSGDVMVYYRELLGHDPDPIHLIRRRGLE
ncbi:MAG: M3 family metallopeptidase [Propionibacteriaceae bacterium]|nr:M3 family metallopeptidase [Propionibacteriaceae bacterium]